MTKGPIVNSQHWNNYAWRRVCLTLKFLFLGPKTDFIGAWLIEMMLRRRYPKNHWELRINGLKNSKIDNKEAIFFFTK